MKTREKIKLSITLDEYASELLRTATGIAIPMHFELNEPRSDYRRMVDLALLAFLRAVIKENREVSFPVMAKLYRETSDDLRARAADEMPKKGIRIMPNDDGLTGFQASRWN